MAQEEESLKVNLSILFKQFFAQGSKKDKHDQLFQMCGKVLEDYVLKHSELVSIKVGSQNNIPVKQILEVYRTSEKEQLNEDLQAVLHKAELEKQIQHHSPIIHQVILENLLRLPDQDLKAQMQKFGQLLIDLTLCNDYAVRSKNHKLLSRIFEHYQQL